jgi:polysaccharide pyruvyl transferase WcaK-like protein
MTAAGPRVGIWGTFDLENYGDLLFPRIAERELLRRLPNAFVRAYSPYGYLHPIELDAGVPAHPLGIWSDERAAELAEQLDCVLIGGGEIIHTQDELLAAHYGVTTPEILDRSPSKFFIEALGPIHERACPVVWHSVGIPFDPSQEDSQRFRKALGSRVYTAVRDEKSQARLEKAGLKTEISVVPDSAFLLTRLFPPDLLRKRVDQLRRLGWYPRRNHALVIQGSRYMIPKIPILADQIAGLLNRRSELVPVLIATGPCHGDHEFADALAATLPIPSYRLPESALVEDLVAAVWGSHGFIGISLHGNITAFCFDKPHVALDLLEFSKLEGFGLMIENPACVVRDPLDVSKAFELSETTVGRLDTLRGLQNRIDVHFDRIADIAANAVAARRDVAPKRPDDNSNLRRAYEIRGRRRVEERFALTQALVASRAREREMQAELERVDLALAQAESQLEQQTARAGTLEQHLAGLERQRDVLHASRSFRYTAPLRKMGQGLRALGFRRR